MGVLRIVATSLTDRVFPGRMTNSAGAAWNSTGAAPCPYGAKLT